MKQLTRKQHIIQILCGLIFLICTAICYLYLQEYTASTVFFLPMGLYLIFTRQKVMEF